MEGQGPALDGHNKEFVKRIADLKSKRQELQMQIHDDEAQKSSYEQQLDMVKRRMAQLHESINRRVELREGYDKIIDDTEIAYNEIMQESENLLSQLTLNTDAIEKGRDGGLYNTMSDASALV